MRGPELADPAERHALLADLVEELQEREPELLDLIRKMLDMTEAVEVELGGVIKELRDQIDELEDASAYWQDRAGE
jgi:hypothetical protein